jgi:MFS family permease
VVTEKDGKKVEEWKNVQEDGKDVEPSKVLKGTSISRQREPGQTISVTIERVAINPATTMLWGQIAEMFLLPLLPFFLFRFGMKWVLVFGMLCWGLRYLLFSAAFPSGPFLAVFIGVLLHGICFDFFFAAAFIHVDNTAPREIRASAQALFSLLTYGVGMWLGSVLSGYLNQAYTSSSIVPTVDWYRFWLVPAYGVIAAVIVFAVFFRIDNSGEQKKA